MMRTTEMVLTTKMMMTPEMMANTESITAVQVKKKQAVLKSGRNKGKVKEQTAMRKGKTSGLDTKQVAKINLRIGAKKMKLLNSSRISPNVDDLLMRPNDEDKTKEDMLNKQDVKIRKMKEKYDEDTSKYDREIEEEKRKREKREINFRVNGVIRDRLEMKFTEANMRYAVKANLSFLMSIQASVTPSGRHEAFQKSVRTREGLRFTMITDPFTDQQLNWTLEELGKVWMRNENERRHNGDYVWKVLVPECLIKVYSDELDVSRAQAEVMMRETPLRDEPRLETGRIEGEEGEYVKEKE